MALATTHLLLIFSLFFSFSFTLGMRVCNPRDRNALTAMKKVFQDPDLLSSWVVGTNCCRWKHVKCDHNNHITELEIISAGRHNISGSIASSIGNLTHLKELVFENFNVIGEIPTSITKLKNLEYLRLSNLNLKGPVPTFLIELSNLYYLDLSLNHFTGSIPPIFSKFTKLLGLNLNANKLTGTIPESFGHFTGVVPNLHFVNNLLTGSIPKSFGNMNFELIDFAGNNLVGDASMLFKLNGSTENGYIIDLSGNMFEFDFSNLNIHKQLYWLDISHNKIYGSVPKDIAMAKELEVFNISYNNLCGKIPFVGQLKKFNSSSYIGNRCLCGLPLPKCVK